MLSSITPLGERGRNNRWGLTAAAYIAGSTAGGALAGTAMGAAGSLVRRLVGDTDPLGGTVPLLVLALIALVGLLADLGIGGLRVPTIRRQVDEGWISTYRGWVYGVGFGFQLGLGVVTIVTSAATWVTLAAAGLTGTWWGGLLVGATFGLARSLPLLLAARARSPVALRDLHRRQQHLASVAHRAAVGGQGLVGALALLALLVTT